MSEINDEALTSGRMLTHDEPWPLDPRCPADYEMGEWLRESQTRGGTLLHFGTGGHHHLGIVGAALNIAVLGMTCSPAEARSFEELIIERPRLGLHYRVMFGDIYTLPFRLVPRLNIVTLFHLCETMDPARDDYGARSPLELARGLIQKLVPHGRAVFYTRSAAYDQALPIIAQLLDEGALSPDTETHYRSLVSYQRA